ncbi:hypothetical protein ZEAMMB73_Zm00001d018831 [Zea mays]|uniref:Uncharacterized protein n=1 Tax=Zea mays TaxID=4577 RepID=A0A1D6HSN6_MAIZE|nr:hypothetical protein ZEAMMB73_Zm00001d018831 [Zea mays]
MAGGHPAPLRPVVVAMKGHPGSGKSTAARAIATALCCPLLDKDDVRDCMLPLEGLAAAGMLNDLSYAVLWRMAERQVRLGLSVVIDSPLSRRSHLDMLTRLAGVLVVVVECRPGDNEEWRRRLESRGSAVANGGGGDGWHKPKTWAELERLLEGYQEQHSVLVSRSIEQAFLMASAGLKPGVPVILRELEPSSEMFKQGASLRVTGSLQSFDVESATATIQDGSVSLKVDTQHLRDVSFRTNSVYQFIGELQIREVDDAILLARIGRNVDGLDMNLYQQALLIRRQHEAKLLSSRRA